MLTSSDFRELSNLFEKHRIRYLVVGGYAVMKYSEHAGKMKKYYAPLKTLARPKRV